MALRRARSVNPISPTMVNTNQYEVGLYSSCFATSSSEYPAERLIRPEARLKVQPIRNSLRTSREMYAARSPDVWLTRAERGAGPILSGSLSSTSLAAVSPAAGIIPSVMKTAISQMTTSLIPKPRVVR